MAEVVMQLRLAKDVIAPGFGARARVLVVDSIDAYNVRWLTDGSRTVTHEECGLPQEMPDEPNGVGRLAGGSIVGIAAMACVRCPVVRKCDLVDIRLFGEL